MSEKTATKVGFLDSLMLIISLFTVTFFVYKDFDIRMLFGYGILCLIILAHFVKKLHKKQRFEFPTVYVGMVFVTAFAVLLMFLRPDSRHDADTLVYVMSMIICMGFLLFMQPGNIECKRVLTVFFVAACVFSGFVIFFTFFEELFWKGYFPILSRASKTYLLKYVNRGYSPVLGGSCTLTDYIIMLGIAAMVGQLISKSQKGIKRSLPLAPMFIFLLAILVVGRRGELLAIVVTLIFAYFLTQTKKQFIIKITVLITMGIAAIVVFVLSIDFLKEISFLSRYVMTVENILSGQDTSSGRFELYTIALSVFAKNPLFGIGWGSFSQHVTAEFREVHGDSVADVHNIYLQFLCETGIVGTILILTPIIYIFVKTVSQTRRLYKREERTEDIILAAKLSGASLTIQTFFLVVGFLDPCFSKNIFWCFFIISVKMLEKAAQLEKHEESDLIARTFKRVMSRVCAKVKRK